MSAPLRCRCPYCRVDHPVIIAINSASRAGTLNICLGCGEMAIFESDWQMRRITAEESAALRQTRNWPLIVKVMRTIQARAAARKERAS